MKKVRKISQYHIYDWRLLTNRVQTPLDTYLLNAELESWCREVPRSCDRDVMSEVIGVILLGWPSGLLDRLVVPVVCPPEVERDADDNVDK